jgi:hypothetical protein
VAEPGQTVLIVSGATSATGSIWRACQALCHGRLEPLKAGSRFYREGRMADLRAWIPPEHGHVILFNAPQHLNPSLDLSRYRFVVNARDPRDLACNQFHWKLVHPSPADGPGDLEKRAEAARRIGIDAFALKANNTPTYRALRDLTDRAPRGSWMFLGYAMWCLAFDEAVARLAAFLGVDLAALPPAQRDAVAKERTPDIAANPRWIGRKWEGADTAPGRHRHELRPETTAALAAKYAEELRWLAGIDDPRMAELYR